MSETIHSSPLDPRLVEDLVAYLDGELGADETRRIEELLASDTRVRAELQRLERTWNALGELPAAAVEPAFTQSTVEMVAVAEEAQLRAVVPAGGDARTLVRYLAAGLAVALAGIGGFVALGALWPDPNALLLRDLTVIERLDQYRHVESIEWLRRLRAEGLFLEPVPAVPPGMSGGGPGFGRPPGDRPGSGPGFGPPPPPQGPQPPIGLSPPPGPSRPGPGPTPPQGTGGRP